MIFSVETKEAFSIIGKEGSTDMGSGFEHELWKYAKSHFVEIMHLAKKDSFGKPVAFWGAMSNFSMNYLPWEDHLSKGLYLAGIECRDNIVPPKGWKKWNIPSFQFLKIECEDSYTYAKGLKYLQNNGLKLQGAVQYYIDTHNGKSYMCFPIKRFS